jgi:TonB family protein
MSEVFIVNKLKINLTLLFALFSLCVTVAFTQHSGPKTISAGVVNSKAKNLPVPEYPAAAKAVKAAGAVNVQVTIDENGNVISAAATSGHPLLKGAAVEAARQAKFSPTLLSGNPVKVTGVIIYNFNLNEASNEERVEILGLSTFLHIVRNLAFDLEKMDQVFGPDDILKEVPAEISNFSKELTPLVSLRETAKEKRLEVIDKVISEVQAKLTEKDAWQFEAGKVFGGLLALFFKASNGDGFDADKLDEQNIKLNLAKIKDLTYSAPPDFPKDVLEKLKQFSDTDIGENISANDNLNELITKLMMLLETISPDSTK